MEGGCVYSGVAIRKGERMNIIARAFTTPAYQMTAMDEFIVWGIITAIILLGWQLYEKIFGGKSGN